MSMTELPPPSPPAPPTPASPAPLLGLDWSTVERLIVLSPHLDDAALSCGGLLTALRGQVSCLTVTLTCGDARARKGFATPAGRRLEDRNAMRSIGCDVAHLGFADAIYRRSPISGQLIYRGIRERISAPPIDDAAHVEELYLVMRRLCLDIGNVVLLSPMAIGRHVDHLLCAHVALRLLGSSPNLFFYEDFPYVVGGTLADIPDDGPQQAMKRLDRTGGERFCVPIDAERKLELLRHYTSQMPILFGSDERMAAAVRGHQENGEPVENYWRTRPARRGNARTPPGSPGGTARRNG
jgi:LmbE family N-acetylglucosaminyl deacetylase